MSLLAQLNGERIIVHNRWRFGNLKKTYLSEVWQLIGIQNEHANV